jgi:hydrogenase maturation protease
MAVSIETKTSVRLLGLGNEILGDDAFGIYVAREVRERYGASLDVVTSFEAGFNLLDLLLGVTHLLVVDAIVTGNAEPGTVFEFDETHLRPVFGQSPHFVGLFEVLAAARALGMRVPRKVTILAAEAADCVTVAGPMHTAVRAAIPAVTARIAQLLLSEVA